MREAHTYGINDGVKVVRQRRRRKSAAIADFNLRDDANKLRPHKRVERPHKNVRKNALQKFATGRNQVLVLMCYIRAQTSFDVSGGLLRTS